MADKPKLWGVGDTHLVYTTKEDAETMSEWLEKQFEQSLIYKKNQKTRFAVIEIFPDCFVNKIKRGYTTWVIKMARDGTVKECKQQPFLPTRFGFNRGSIQLTEYVHNIAANTYIQTKSIIYTALAKDKEEAIALCEKYRIKTLIDDIWNKQEPAF